MMISWKDEMRCLGRKFREIVPPHLATFVHKNKLEDITCTPIHRRNFSGYPTLFLVWEPYAGSFAVDVLGHFNLPGAVDYLNFDSDLITSTADRPPTLEMLCFLR